MMLAPLVAARPSWGGPEAGVSWSRFSPIDSRPPGPVCNTQLSWMLVRAPTTIRPWSPRSVAFGAVVLVALELPWFVHVPYFLHLVVLALVWTVLAQGQNLDRYLGYAVRLTAAAKGPYLDVESVPDAGA